MRPPMLHQLRKMQNQLNLGWRMLEICRGVMVVGVARKG